MKNLKKAIILVGLSLSTLIAKSNNSIGNEIALEAGKTIKESVKQPALNHSQNIKVQVLFTTNENGNVNFVLVKTTDQDLKHDIEKQFYGMRFSKLKHDVVNSVVLNFKTI